MVTIHDYYVANQYSKGLGALLPSSCIVKEELNGMFELELVHPYDEFGKFERLKEDRIIKAPTPRREQFFRIYKIVKDIKNIKVFARHITYDLEEIQIDPFEKLNSTGQNAVQRMEFYFFDNETNQLNQKIMLYSNIKTVADFKIKRKTSVLKMLVGDEEFQESFLKTYGGEIERDNFSFGIKTAIGRDRGFTIRYGKNLIGLTVDEDYSNVCNQIYAYGNEGIELRENPIKSEDGAFSHREKSKIIHLNESTEEGLRHNAYKILEASKFPTVNIRVNFQLLSKTAEYEQFKELEKIELGDIVTVENAKMKFKKKATVISYEYNSLSQKYEKIELGDFVQDITSNFSNLDKTLQSTTTTSKQLINMLNRNITIQNDNLYILVDNPDITKARKLFKFGANGLEHSTTGVNGQYRTIIDSNGNLRQ